VSVVRPARWRNVALYVGGVLALSTAGGVVIAGGEEAGGLLFILSPVLMAAALRFFGGDGWGDAGLRWTGPARWSVLAALAFPLIFAVTLGVGAAAGRVRFTDGFSAGLLLAIAAQLAPRFLFAIAEEFGWRGYLEPRLAALGVAAARRHLAVAVVWGVWHLPYILATEGYTRLPLAVHLPLFMLAVMAMAFWYGTVQARTGSVWPAVLAHGVANTVAFPLLDETLVVIDDPLWFAARPEALVPLALLVTLGTVVWGLRGSAARRAAQV